LPTICNLIDRNDIMQSLNITGINILPQLLGEQEATNERTLYWKTGQMYAVRKGDMKLLVNRNDNSLELYDLNGDFRETNNIYEKQQEITRQLLQVLEDFKKED